MKRTLSLLALLGLFAAQTDAAPKNEIRRVRPRVAGGPSVQIRLPERFRLLTDQLFDLRVEATGLTNPATASIQVTINGSDVTASLPAPEVTTDNDANSADGDKAWTYRAYSFPAEGVKTVVATVTDGASNGSRVQRIGVQKLSFGANGTLPRKNIVLYIGDAMGTAYRDAGRLVAKSTGNRFREGFFDDLQEMDKMASTGMVMTYAQDRIVPDSANTATAWASGNKTVDGSLNVFADNNDFKFNSSTATLQTTKQFALDNPRVESLWQYLKRLYGYKTGIVSTADITDATPGGEGGYSLLRALTFDIARQYTDGVWTAGPEFDVILGGGTEHFDRRNATNSGDTRDFTAELQTAGFTYVTNRTDLNALTVAPDKLLGLFYRAASVSNTGANGNMNVAYDKLGITRPSDEPAPSFNGFVDQPFLDEMTSKAIATLNKNGGPFILMVEAASIDKQSHPNHEAGVVWDTIELDKAIAVGRNFGNNNGTAQNTKTLVLVTADHDQSLSIVGLTDTNATGGVINTRSYSIYPKTGSNARTEYNPTITPGVGPGIGATAGVAPANFGNNAGEVTGFPNYSDATYSGGVYPDNANQFKLAVGFRTGNHTGSSVPITADGPGASLFVGYFDQTDIFFKMSRVLSSDTSPLDEFQKARSRFGIISQNY
ncbi:MAG: alkaline phosphatase [Chthoniobacterales bacterium]